MDRSIQRIATERIAILFRLADENYRSHPERADRYIDLARKIASRNRVHIPGSLKWRICRGCKRLLTPNSSRTRMRQSRAPHITVTCLRCGHINRKPLGRKTK